MQRCILSFNNREEVLELPVPLQAWTLDDPHNTYEFSSLQTGDVLAIGSRKLQMLSIDSFFPHTKDYSFLVTRDFPEPFVCVEMIRKWKNSKRPVRVIITGTDINHAMAIKNFSYGKNDNTEDVSFTLDLIEYRFLNQDASKESASVSGKQATGENELLPRADEDLVPSSGIVEYTVRQGDTLIGIAEKVLGDASKWRDIASLNKLNNPNLIFPNQKLNIRKEG